MSSNTYDASAIEVLTGLDPVRKRPGMYTDTTRPNHLAQEVIDNSVDEALAGHANQIHVTLHADGSLSVADNGRGMPVDMHPEQRKPGVEVILCTLHAGGRIWIFQTVCQTFQRCQHFWSPVDDPYRLATPDDANQLTRFDLAYRDLHRSTGGERTGTG